MSVNLRFSNHIHDTFLHIPASLYMKLFTQTMPSMQLVSDEILSFWCIKDISLTDGIVAINSKFAEYLKLKSGTDYKITLGPVKCVNLSKVIVSLLNGASDWKFLNENYETIQSLILDQIRLIKKGQSLPIYTNIRKTPLWITIEEFGGYKAPAVLGIISNDTELVVIDSISDDHIYKRFETEIPPLISVPTSDFYFSCNSSHEIPELCSYRDESFRIRKCESVPRNVIFVPDIILSKFFKIHPKEKICLSSGSKISNSYSGTYNFSINENACEFESNQHSNETIISTPNGIVIKTSEIDYNQMNRIKPLDIPIKNSIADLLLETFYKCVLFHGQAGSGKTKAAQAAICHLSYSSNFLSQLIYIDLLTSSLDINFLEESSIVFVIDHVDEYLQSQSEIDKDITKYILLYKKIIDILQICKDNRVILISRSSEIFSKYSSIAMFQFDLIFKSEDSKNWNFEINPEPLISVFGLNEAKSLLEKFILNPLQFSYAYKTNQMDVHSSVLISGPPGSGKTFLAQKFIEHHNIPCIKIRGPEILDKYVGASERGVRELFSRARTLKPCIIFFDEIDSLVPKRGSNQSGVTDRIVNQFLTELDGTEDRSGVFIIATTSRPDLIDKAIVRPGRIDQNIKLDYPKIEELKQFFIYKGLKAKKLRILLNLIGNDANLTISWADLASIDWNESSNVVADLMQAISVRSNNSRKKDSMQKLTLA